MKVAKISCNLKPCFQVLLVIVYVNDFALPPAFLCCKHQQVTLQHLVDVCAQHFLLSRTYSTYKRRNESQVTSTVTPTIMSRPVDGRLWWIGSEIGDGESGHVADDFAM